MQEIFYEESSKIVNEKSEKLKYNLLLIMAIFCFFVSFIWIFVCFFIYDITLASVIVNVISTVLPFVVFLFLGILCLRFKNNFCIQYDYTFISGSIRIDKVIKNIKRVPKYNFEYNQIDMIGRFASDTYFQFGSNPDVNRELLTADSSSVDLFYLCVTISGEKNILILQCTEKFIAHIIKFTGKTVLEKDFR